MSAETPTVRTKSFLIALVGVFFFGGVYALTGYGSGVYHSSSITPAVNGSSVAAVVAGQLAWKNAVKCDVEGYATDGSAHTISGPTFDGLQGDVYRWWHSYGCTVTATGNDGDVSNHSITVDADGGECAAGFTFNATTGECDADGPSCDGTVTGDAFLRPVFSGGDTGNICHESTQCKLIPTTVTGVGADDLIEYTGTSENCDPGDSEIPISETNEQPMCIVSGGDTWCAEPNLADQNCGYFNDDYVCLDAVPPGECTFFGSGNMVCDAGAGSPPAPDNGTPGTPATPDATIDNNGTDVDVFNSGTVGTSSGPATGGAGSGSTGGSPAPGEGLELDFSEIIEEAGPAAGYRGDIDDQTTDTGAELDDLITDIGTTETFAETTTLGSDLSDALPAVSCADLTIPAGPFTATITCADAAPVRDLIGWCLRLAFLFAMFHLITTRPR